ncbi:LysR substrate-binding domain-containing protein [Thalassotalea euphylliae]|uniref:LysR family transcriptional regulator n=1 Tax=Thalassotalea euphylliae TaxID=1655234 RepID=A0A3E0UH49_9GAMM|nr:LysR substrate-binding domain-containing protein [Thalassotalea euphylliae]REL35934.1 LysR family transcriptional regulator [Thalassotalea euphylliae]
MHIPLKALRFFMLAAQQGSFKAAAESLFVTQAAVSQQIRLLEDSIGCQLFDRHGGKTLLTTQGELLLPYIVQGFNQFEQGIASLSQSSNPNELRLTTFHSLTSLILIPNIDQFNTAHPEIHIQFSPNNKLDDLASQNLDIAIRRGKGNYVGLESRKLVDDDIVLVASSTLIGEQPPKVEQLLSIPLLEDTSDEYQKAIVQFLTKCKINREQLNISLRTSDSLPLIQYALAGKGMAFVSRALVSNFLADGTLVELLDYRFETEHALYLVAPSHHFSFTKVQHFERWITQLFGQ